MSEEKNFSKKIVIPIGISGSGKSTYIKKHYDSEIVVCPDDLRREMTGNVSDLSMDNLLWAHIPIIMQHIVKEHGIVVLDATNVVSEYRNRLLDKFDKDCFFEAIIFKIDPEEAKNRVSGDIEKGLDRSNVPEDVIDKQHEHFVHSLGDLDRFNSVIFVHKI